MMMISSSSSSNSSISNSSSSSSSSSGSKCDTNYLPLLVDCRMDFLTYQSNTVINKTITQSPRTYDNRLLVILTEYLV